MSTQQELFSESKPQGPRAQPASSEGAPAPVWLQRLSLVVLVIFCFYIGGLLSVLPWWPRYWAQNGWLMGHPAVDAVLQRGWVRGVVSGIGIIDVWIGISEMVNYRDYRV